MKTRTITKEQLAQALQKWEQLHRSGGCLAAEAADVLPVEEVAAAGADALWQWLDEVVAETA
ncbi:hypothetical protein [Delftia tsuruhatensis]|uniref:Uncharacterized protein n=1 Tax=Delftia tsuruhatensis TaxID=180282 RepID=A0ABN4SEH7_9BURK|nr:hypothetical protein [Delftia tsuruhatensis]AOV01698.1 hypothetical protein BI380_10195 [Delftia tsuruhatensis]AOV02404.1 hypothetical protein BI380_14185 [Delftia tsuruhatensis]